MNLSPTVQIALIAAVVLFLLILIFRRRVSEVSFGPAKLTLLKPEDEKAARDAGEQQAKQDSATKASAVQPKWESVASLYWLGNDLMWIIDMMARAAPPDHVLNGVKSSIQYLQDLAFAKNSFPMQQLTLATDILESISGVKDERLLQQHYRTIAQQIQSTKWFISALAADKQPGFQKLGVGR